MDKDSWHERGEKEVREGSRDACSVRLFTCPLLPCPPARTTDDAIGAGNEMIEIEETIVVVALLEVVGAVVDTGTVGGEEIVVLEVP